MNRLLRQIALVCGKDLRIEARSRETITLVMMMGVLIVVVLAFGLAPGRLTNGPAATAILWVAYLFSGVLCFEKTMAVERNDGALAGLMLAPIDRTVIYLAKLLTNLTLMFAMAVVVTLAGAVLFGFDLSAAPGQFLLIMVLNFVGFSAVGTLFATAVSSSRLRGGLLAIIIFPIVLPLVIASNQLLLAAFKDGKPLNWGGIGLLGAFDLIYLAVSWLVFELLLEP